MTEAQPTSEPTLRSVTLYKHGVGAFGWSATVGVDGTLTLPVPAQQIDDVLKSLLVVAADGSGVGSIAYAADEPLQRQLRNFGVDLQNVGGLADLLGRMVGATVRLRRGTETLEGQIIATEVVDREGREQTVRDEWLLLLTAQGTIERVELAAVRGLEIIKGETAARLTEQLDLLRQAHQPDVTRLVLTAQPGQQLELSYVAEAPVWKMTYRIVLGDGKPWLQGWAIAENTSTTAWTGVELALISGQPLSFTLDLRHPRFRTRPVATIPDLEAIAPPVAESAIMPTPMMASGGFSAMEADAEPLARGARGAARSAMKRMDIAAAPPPPTTTRAVGELFEYRIDQPVTIPAQQAALIPVLATAVEGAAVSVYNATVHVAHPLNAVRLTNSTALTLDAGPLTVLQDNTYVGEALIDVIKPGEQRLVSYAVDLGCRVEAQQQSGRGVLAQIRVQRGQLISGLRETATTTYRLSNVTDGARTVIIEHPVRQGWDVPTPTPVETTPNYQRYEVQVPARQGAQLVVRDGHTLSESTALYTSSADYIAWLITQVGGDPQVRAQLEPLAAQFRQVSERQAAVARIQVEIDVLGQDQARLRSNLQALGQGMEERDLARRYVAELTQSEDRMGELRSALADAQRGVEQATAALHALIDGLDFEQVVNGAANERG